LTVKTAVTAIKEYVPEVEQPEETEDNLPKGDYIEGVWMPPLDTYISREQMRDLAYGYFVRQKPLSHSFWTPAKTNGFSELVFQHLQHYLIINNCAAWGDPTHKSGIYLNPKGERFLYRFLPTKYKPTTPPLKKYYPEPLPQREEKTDRQTEEGSGAGEEADHVE